MIKKILFSLGIGVLIFLLGGYARFKLDPYYPYRDSEKKAVDIKEKSLKYFANEEQLIRDKLKLSLSERERAILSGLHWVINLVDDDKNFKYIFPDLLLLIDSLSTSRGRSHQQEVTQSIVKTALMRGSLQLTDIYGGKETGLWDFIRVFPILAKYPGLEKEYFSFYQKKWPDPKKSDPPTLKEFSHAIKTSNYKNIFDALVATSFPHYYLLKTKNPIALPVNAFPTFLQELKKFDYREHAIGDPDFRNLGYLVTHVPLVLTNYGEYPLQEDINKNKAQKYIESSLEKARQLGDFDLYAEYIQCIKMFRPSNDPQVVELDRFIYNLQRSDGSWGSKNDFKTNAYTAIHPTGAALMALNQTHE